MKQTQTKLFDFSDFGLGFCAGSKNLFPDRFKKILAQGYNTQTVASVDVVGNQVTLIYGVSHGYAADRVLKVNSGALASINGGEFWIDSVTTNTLTFTFDDAPISITGNFTTHIASLGWQLVYENTNIHVYRFKHIDDTDMYARFCFQNQIARRNCISPCVGKAFDVTTGFITDENALTINTDIATPGTGFKWEFQTVAAATHDNYTYSQGYATYGRAMVIGSLYHFVMLTNGDTGTRRSMTNGILPAACLNYEKLKYPLLMGYTYGSITAAFDIYEARVQRAYVSSISVVFDAFAVQSSSYLIGVNLCKNNYVSAEIDNFNTTTAEPLSIYEDATGQRLGVLYGAYKLQVASISLYPTGFQQTPSMTVDIDFEHSVLIHSGGSNTSSEGNNAYFLAYAVEEIKIA